MKKRGADSNLLAVVTALMLSALLVYTSKLSEQKRLAFGEVLSRLYEMPPANSLGPCSTDPAAASGLLWSMLPTF